MDLLHILNAGLAYSSIDEFYSLARICLVKDESHYDKFDVAFSAFFKGVQQVQFAQEGEQFQKWLKSNLDQLLSDEEKERLQKLGGLQQLLDNLPKAANIESEAVGNSSQDFMKAKGESGGRAWNERQYRNLDSSVELGVRNIKIALRRLRKFARVGANSELDIDSTIRSTAHKGGLLDIKMRPKRRNTAKVLLFFDIGGSMDMHVKACETLFSAAHLEFKHMVYFYFHNFIYEFVWQDHKQQNLGKVDHDDVLRRYGSDYRVIFIGDASMSPLEITHAGGSVGHWNEKPGMYWMKKMLDSYPKFVWLNPVPESNWSFVPSIVLTQKLLNGNMYPLSVYGIDAAMAHLSK